MLKIESLQQFHLLVSADARAAGMGDMGVATSTDVFPNNGIQQNAFAIDQQGFSISYTPYLTGFSK
jgi:hypothetical protein